MRRLRKLFLIAAAGALAVAFSPRIDRLADVSFEWHMVQHLLLLFVVPPLLLAGAPLEWFARHLSRPQAIAFTHVLRSAPVRALTFPPLCLAVYVFALWITHLTPLYDAALGNAALHMAEHALYLFAGLLFWLPVIGVPPLTPVSYPAKLLYLFLAMPQCAFLGAALYNARAPLYPHYVRVESFDGALADQANAAASMWICGGLLVFIVMLCVVAAWGIRERREQPL